MMNNSSRDIDLEKRIDAYVKGRLTQEEAEELWVELLKRPDYIDLLETELHVKSIIDRRAGRVENAAPAKPVFFKKPWKWAAAATFAGILVVALSLLRGPDEEAIQPLALSAINMVEHLASPDVVRAKKSDLSKADSLLNDGFKTAVSNQPEEALQTYGYVISTYPDDAKALAQAHFNIGIIRYNAGRFTEAKAAFTSAMPKIEDDRILEEKAKWFLVNTHIHLGEFSPARDMAEQVQAMDGIYRKAASRLIERLDRKLRDPDNENPQ